MPTLERVGLSRHVSPALVAAALTGLILASAGAADSPPPTSLCKYGGQRFVGTTSQGKDLCFTLSPKGKVMREYAYDYLDTCGSGMARALNPIAGVMPVARTGAFVQLGPGGFFKGTVRGKTASGTFRQHDADTVIGKGQLACDTHLVHWTARRVN
jgi:hypothetical protein